MASLTFLLHPDSFTAAFVMTATPREKFGEPGVPDTDAAGTPKWRVDIAVTTPAPAGRGPVSDIITVTVPAHKAADIPPTGTPVVFHGLRAGVSAPSLRGDRVTGGTAYFQADRIVPAHQAQPAKAA